jgi:carbon-monoxide dehydrogenase large subunit
MVRLLRHVVVDDCGRLVNPMLVEGQLHGALAQGVGGALLESIVYGEGAECLTATFMDYLLPTAAEMPPIELVHVETPPSATVAGFKGAAEGGTIGSVAAIANAVADALAPFEVEIRELPVSPDRLVRMLRAADHRTTGEDT